MLFRSRSTSCLRLIRSQRAIQISIASAWVSGRPCAWPVAISGCGMSNASRTAVLDLDSLLPSLIACDCSIVVMVLRSPRGGYDMEPARPAAQDLMELLVILFPAIDLKDGQCVRLKLGEMSQATVFRSEERRVGKECRL